MALCPVSYRFVRRAANGSGPEPATHDQRGEGVMGRRVTVATAAINGCFDVDKPQYERRKIFEVLALSLVQSCDHSS